MRIALLLAVASAIAWNLADRPNKSSSEHKAEVAQQAPANPFPLTVVIDNAQRSEPTQPTKPEAPSGNTAPEWALVVVGILTCIILVWQAHETRRSVAAIRESLSHQRDTAAAALLNAKALINSERPWVMVQITEEKKELPEEQGVGLLGGRVFQFAIFNYGKTPAHITNYTELAFDFLKDPDTELPIPPKYGEPNKSRRFIAPRDSFVVGDFNPHVTRMNAIVERAGGGKTTQSDLSLVVYGVVEYEDGISAKSYKTAFCYRHERDWIRGSLVPCGPFIYNEYT
jgi:hypothetical protein